ncbi:MAG: hypothetical protein JWP25_8490 [Bradyrhizobium sp.]|jgi:hypothetical protein|nr:hypothetical protein [Bradyrhizobium sp.]
MSSTQKTGPGKSDAKKSTPKRTKAKKAVAKKASAAKAQIPKAADDDSARATIAAPAPAQPKNEEQMHSLIKGIDAPSLHDDDIATTLKHLNSVVAFRRAIGQPGAASKRSVSGKCYLKSAGDPIVSVYEGLYHVGSMSEDSAIALGIPRCG